MPDGWESGGLTEITIPGDAGPNDPRVYVGQDDPLLTAINQDAGIVLYWANGRAFVISVEASGGPDHGQLHIWSNDEINGLKQLIDLDHDVPSDSATVNLGQGGSAQAVDVTLSGDVIRIGGLFTTSVNLGASLPPSNLAGPDVTLYGQTMPRGLVPGGITDTTASGAAIGTTETVALTIPATTYRAGRAYQVVMKGGFTPSIANAVVQTRIRKTNVAGQDLGEFFRYPLSLANLPHNGYGTGVIFTVGAADVTAAICLTLQASAGATVTHAANSTNPRRLEIFDINDASMYPSNPVLV